MNIIIFGISGQDGFYLKQLCERNGYNVIGVSRSVGDWIQNSVTDRKFVFDLISKYQPFSVFHFAANSTTKHFALFENHETISTGTLNILEAVRLHSPHTKVFLSGSAMQFKNEGLPIDEKTPFEASSAYSVSRIQSVYAGRYYREKFGLKVYVGYFFNHDSPLRSEQHVNQKIVRGVQRIISGNNEMMELGNIDVKKEFNFAGDVAQAVWILVSQDNVFEAIIGSGKAYTIKDWLISCFAKTGKNFWDFIIIKQDYLPEYQLLVSNPQLIYSLGWKPEVGFEQLTDLMMNHYE